MKTKKSGYQKLKEENERLKQQINLLVLQASSPEAVQLRHVIRFQAKMNGTLLAGSVNATTADQTCSTTAEAAQSFIDTGKQTGL